LDAVPEGLKRLRKNSDSQAKLEKYVPQRLNVVSQEVVVIEACSADGRQLVKA
jgi:hypothetical protein